MPRKDELKNDISVVDEDNGPEMPTPSSPSSESTSPSDKPSAIVRMGAGTNVMMHNIIDLAVKIYNDFRLAVLSCLFSLLYMTYELLMRIITIPAAEVSPEMLGVVASFLTAVAANIKFFLEERKSDAEDKREHDQWMERQQLRISIAREGLDVELESTSD